MEPERLDDKLDEVIGRAISRERPQLDFDKWKESHKKEIGEFNLQSGQASGPGQQFDLWRTIMKSRMAKTAAAAVIVVGVLVVVYLMGGPDMAGVAWGSLAERVGQIRTCIYRGHGNTVRSDPNGEESHEMQMEMEVFFSSAHGYRMDSYTDGKIMSMQYVLPTEKAIIGVMPASKNYMRMLLTEEHLRKMREEGRDPREMVRQIVSLEYEELGRDTIDGIEVEGIETNDLRYSGGMFDAFTGRLWVDVESGWPVRMEMEMQTDTGDGQSMQMSLVMEDFEWDVELEPSVFEPNIPEDYTLLGEMALPGQDEGSAVAGLRLFAEITDGRYPKSLSMMKVMREVTETMKDEFDPNGIEGDPNSEEYKQELRAMQMKMLKRMMPVQGVCMFYAELVKDDKDPAYYGDMVTAEDADSVLMRWKVADDEYRVIFGGLTTENVSVERLAELEAPFAE